MLQLILEMSYEIMDEFMSSIEVRPYLQKRRHNIN
jgi:hypothetical protein